MMMRCSPGDRATTGLVRLAELGDSSPTTDVIVWDWRRRTATRFASDGTWSATLAPEEWTFHVVAPILDCGIAIIGDTSKFVSAGDARMVVSATPGGLRVVVLGVGELVTITGWSEYAPTRTDGDIRHDPATGVWTTDVDVASRGWTSIQLGARYR